VKAGPLDRRVQFQRPQLVDNGVEEVEEFANHGVPIWASKTDVSDGERLRADQMSASLTSRFVVRWSPFTAGLTAKDRIAYGDDTFEIFGIKEIGRREGLEITAGVRVD
jgi:SPP1 family predicted phage head-tail adaptor